jgi:hypothetical protein
MPLHTCAFGDRTQRCPRRPDRSVQFDGRLRDPLPRGGHLGGALLQLVFALRHLLGIHCCATNLDKILRK